MNYPENMPSSEHTKHPITEAEIAKQGYELEAQDARARHLMAYQALINDQESVKLVGDLLTSRHDPMPSAMDSEILRSAMHIEDSDT